jgi:hypothetical protein
LLNVLESIDYKRCKSITAQYLIIININAFNSVKTFNLAKENERTQVVLCEYKFLKFGEFF